QVGVPANLMAAANSSGGVMGKMIDAQSIVGASTATEWYGHEGEILRYVFFHSIALPALVGVWGTLQAYLFPFTRLGVRYKDEKPPREKDFRTLLPDPDPQRLRQTALVPAKASISIRNADASRCSNGEIK